MHMEQPDPELGLMWDTKPEQRSKLSEFRAYAREGISRRRRTLVTCAWLCYIASDVGAAAMPIIDNGFVRSVIELNPDLGLFLSAYGDSPVPLLYATASVCSALIMRWNFSAAFALAGLATCALGADLVINSRVPEAESLLLSVAGCALAAFYAPLEKRFGEAKHWVVKESIGNPKRTAGALLIAGNVPLFASACYSYDISMMAMSAGYFAGNIITLILPRGNVNAAQTSAPAPV